MISFADMRLCFRLCTLLVFSWGGSYHTKYTEVYFIITPSGIFGTFNMSCQSHSCPSHNYVLFLLKNNNNNFPEQTSDKDRLWRGWRLTAVPNVVSPRDQDFRPDLRTCGQITVHTQLQRYTLMAHVCFHIWHTIYT